jgi:hypothetical protein
LLASWESTAGHGRILLSIQVLIQRVRRKTHDRAGSKVSDTDLGPYANVGARYKLNDRATISGEITRAGDTANKWGGAANATGASATLKLGF